MRIELLYFEGCPGYEALLPRIRALVCERGIDEDTIRLRRVETPAAAQSERFLGSPTLRIHGRDVEPGADLRTDFGLQCRIYRGPNGGSAALPPDEWIIDALAAVATRVPRRGPGADDA